MGHTLLRSIFLIAVLSMSFMSSRTLADSLDTRVRTLMDEYHVPGMAVALVRKDQVIESRVYGLSNVELDVRVTENTSFQIASSTKPIIGTLLMMLVEDGVLSLD